MKRKGLWATLLLAVLTTGVQAKDDTPYVVMISIDGFRHDYVEKHNAANIAQIAKDGVRAEKMIPVYPSSTFPNHISIITGLLPVHHGIVNNAFYDKSRPVKDSYARYSMGKGYGDSTWLSGMPFWNLVEFNGLKAATYFWPESDARINGNLPSYHYHYSKYADYQGRIDQITEWLSLPEVSRPHFIAGYFSLVDTQGHDFGPDAKETYDAVQLIDGLIGQLYGRIKQLDIPVNLVLVSDHGMTAIRQESKVVEAELGISDKFAVETRGSQVLIYGKKGTTEQEISALKASLEDTAKGRYSVMSDSRRASVHMERNQRTGDIMLEIRPPGYFVSDSTHDGKGAHGFDATLDDMAATFIAAGPDFRQGATIPPMKNLEIYPGLAKLMKLEFVPETDSGSNTFNLGLAEQ